MYSIDEKGIVWRKSGAEIIILNLGSGHYYTLNETGVLIWEGILEQLSSEIIAQNLTESFEVEYKMALQDTQECLKQLVREGIVSHQRLSTHENDSEFSPTASHG